MKNILLIFSLIITQSLFSQIKYVESDIKSFIDFTSKEVNLTYNSYSVEGTYANTGKNGFIIVEGGGYVWIINHQTDTGIKGIDILKGDYQTVLKEFNKKRKYKKSQLVFSNLPSDKVIVGYNLITESEMKFNAEVMSSPLLGVYKIQILKHRNMDYKNSDTFGKLYITEAGVTVESEIPSLALLRGSYDKKNTNLEKGRFVCNVSKGYGEIFSLTLNMKYSVGAISVINGSTAVTTPYKIVE